MINSKELFLQNIYLYDIEACHANILRSIGFDFEINDDKLERNIQIGKLQNEYPNLKGFFRNLTNSTLEYFKNFNNVKEEDYILQQYDGILSRRILNPLKHGNLKIYLRQVFDIFLISCDKRSYIAYDYSNNEIVIKGVPNRYPAMDEIFKILIRFNFTNKNILFIQLQKLKNDIIYGNINKDIYFIDDEDGNCSVFFHDYGQMKIGKTMKKFIQINQINTKWYFDNYITPFTKSIVKTFV